MSIVFVWYDIKLTITSTFFKEFPAIEATTVHGFVKLFFLKEKKTKLVKSQINVFALGCKKGLSY